ncbi:MAG: hypothetical protein ABJE47_02880 [bacterium]
MRVETIPVILGVIVGLVGLAILADAWLPEELAFNRERRRQERSERHTAGEACIGLSVLCMAAALIGRDSWAYETVAIMVAAVLFLVGVVLNREFLREKIVNRGALRRGGAPKPPRPEGKDRIR